MVFRKAVIQASLGGVDFKPDHVPQSIPYDHHLFTDENFPPRKALSPRLQAKIPKFFGWQLVPDYDYYFWIDGNLKFGDSRALEHYFDPKYDLVVLRHPKRPNIRQEARYLRKGINQQSIYMVSRYAGEWNKEQESEFKDFKDDLLIIGGFFMYRNTKKVQELLKEWWYLTSRYTVFDQLSFSYLVGKSDLKVKVLDEDFNNTPYLKVLRHKKRNA